MFGLIWIQSDTQMVFLKEFFEKFDFEKNQQTTKSLKIFPGGRLCQVAQSGFFLACVDALHPTVAPLNNFSVM